MVFKVIFYIGAIGNMIYFIATEIAIVYLNWIEFFSPFFQIKAFWSVIISPLFWMLLTLNVVGFFAHMGVEKVREDMNKPNF